VVGLLKGKGEGKSLALCGHLDVVGVAGMIDAFTPRVKEGRLYGRGSQDMKGGLAASLAALKYLRDEGIALNGDVYFAGVADEEYASIGTQHFVQNYRVDAAVITDPLGLQVCIAHKGFSWFEIVTHDQAVHGSNYEEGVDAILHMGRVLVELEKMAKELEHGFQHPLLGPASLHASLISGGKELSTYPDECRLKIEWRTLPGQTPELLSGMLQSILDRLAREDTHFNAQLEPPLLIREPFEISLDAYFVQVVLESAEEETGKKPELLSMPGWADTALFSSAGMDALMFGPPGEGLHSLVEWVDLQSVEQTAQVLVKTMQIFCA